MEWLINLWHKPEFQTAIYLLAASALGWLADKMTAAGGFWATLAKPLKTLIDWLSGNRAHS